MGHIIYNIRVLGVFLFRVCVYLLDSLGAGNIYKQLLNEIMKVD